MVKIVYTDKTFLLQKFSEIRRVLKNIIDDYSREFTKYIYILLRETFVSFLFKTLDDFFSTFFDCCFYNFVSLVIWLRSLKGLLDVGFEPSTFPAHAIVFKSLSKYCSVFIISINNSDMIKLFRYRIFFLYKSTFYINVITIIFKMWDS